MFTFPRCLTAIPKWKSVMVGARKIKCENCGATLQPNKGSKEKLDIMTGLGVGTGIAIAAYAVNMGNLIGVIFAFIVLFVFACVATVVMTEFEVVDS